MAERQKLQIDVCVHHWLLARPRDGAVEAECKKCGSQRTYADNALKRVWTSRTRRQEAG